MSKYTHQRDADNTEKLNSVLEGLPEFCKEYFVGIAQRTTPLTRLNYAYDLRVFFTYLTTHVASCKNKDARNITLIDIENLSPFDFEYYLQYLSFYKDEQGNEVSNTEQGKSRKLSSVRSLLRYFEKKGLLKHNPTVSVDNPKIRPKDIVRLEKDEISQMLDVVDSGEGLTERQSKYAENTKLRDYAIVGLLLGTGIRVSELVGIDVEDVDFDNLSFVVTRKGGARVILYFSDEVAGMLYDYYYWRKSYTGAPKETALFLSLQNKRISTRAVENIVKKYSKIAVPLKNITPHKLRSTFGTQLYRSTGDIYVVADVLGHKDVNTTKKHYAAISDDIRRSASKKITLRESDDSDGE
ncbi:MAG TPA: tyrosine-type recombinase/integrase [Candidatus Limihabitans stercoravium]|nr:tyrosine-type recombinase/integrase [Candidatus Limihabitans stercoravium]